MIDDVRAMDRALSTTFASDIINLRSHIKHFPMSAIFVRYILPIIAVAGLVFSILYVRRTGGADATIAPARSGQTPDRPFENTVAGAGVVEPQSENISIGTPTPGIVAEVPVVVGMKVKPGDLLFRMDDRQLRAELQTSEAALAVAKAELTKLENEPRPEQVAVDEARLAEADAWEVEARKKLERVTKLAATNAMTDADLDAAQRQADVAIAQHNRTRAQLYLRQAGAWEYDKAIARQNIAQAQADVSRVKTELDRLEIRAPRQAEVLQVNVRPGEYAGTQPGAALIVLGSTELLHVRVDVDEQDIGRYQAGVPGVAMPRGFPDLKYPLKFKRVEPFVVPKKSLTGGNTERVDTRVLQVIYEVEKNDPPLYVGQQVDVFLKLPEKPPQ
jgi:multidrug resistance efflux pump